MCGKRLPMVARAELFGSQNRCGSPVRVVTSPPPKGAVGLEAMAAFLAGNNDLPIPVLADLDWHGLVVCGTIAQHTILIVSPSPERAITLESQGIPLPAVIWLQSVSVPM